MVGAPAGVRLRKQFSARLWRRPLIGALKLERDQRLAVKQAGLGKLNLVTVPCENRDSFNVCLTSNYNL